MIFMVCDFLYPGIAQQKVSTLCPAYPMKEFLHYNYTVFILIEAAAAINVSLAYRCGY